MNTRSLIALVVMFLFGGMLMAAVPAGSQNGDQCVGKIFGDGVPEGTFSLNGGTITFDGGTNPLGFSADGVLITSVTVFGANQTVTRTFDGGTTSGVVFGPAKTVGNAEGFHDVSHVTQVCFISAAQGADETTTTLAPTTTIGPATTTTSALVGPAEETTTTAQVGGVEETTTTQPSRVRGQGEDSQAELSDDADDAQVAGVTVEREEEREEERPRSAQVESEEEEQPQPAAPADEVEEQPRFTG